MKQTAILAAFVAMAMSVLPAFAMLPDRTDVEHTGIHAFTGGAVDLATTWKIDGTEVTAAAATINGLDARVTTLEATGVGDVVTAVGTQTETASPLVTTVITLVNAVLTATDGSAEGESLKIFDADKGQFTVLSAVMNGSITATAPLVGDYAVSVGTVAASDAADLTGTEVDVIPSTAITSTGGTVLTAAFDAVLASPAAFDGTGTAKDIYLNLGIADAAITGGNPTFTFTGTLTLVTTKAISNQ